MSWLKKLIRSWLGIEKKTWTIVLDGKVSREMSFDFDRPYGFLEGLEVPDLGPAKFIDEKSFFAPEITVSRKVYSLIDLKREPRVASYISFKEPTE